MVTLSYLRDMGLYSLKSMSYAGAFRRRRGNVFLNGDSAAPATPAPQSTDNANLLILKQLSSLARELLSVWDVLRRRSVERI
jgi:hypothetical protein